MKPILYSYFRSSSAYRVRIALNLKNIEFEYRPVHLLNDGGEQLKDEYLNLNPKGEVPYLVHEKRGISQSMAILHYLDLAFEEKPLFPSDMDQRIKCIELCEIVNSGIQPIQNLKVVKHLIKNYKLDPSEKEKWISHWIEEGFNALEAYLQKTSGAFSLGDQVSAADCFVIPQVYNAVRFNVDMNRYPNIQKINENCLELEPFQKAAPEQQPDS